MDPCEEVGELLSAAIDDELPSSAAGTVADHLTACPSCRVEHERLMQVRSLMRSLPPRSVPPRVRTSLREAAWRRSVAARHRRFLAAAALVAAAATGGTLAVLAGNDEAAPVSVEQLVQEHLVVSDGDVFSFRSKP